MLASSTELSYFNEVCNTLNFSRAAERLGITQPTLSQAIKRLESHIGTPLFMRIKTGVKLTKAGEQLQLHSHELIRLWDQVKAASLASSHEVQGRIVIGCHPMVAQEYFSTLLPNLLATYPHLEIAFVHDLSRKITEGVINLSIDLGVVVNPIHHLNLILHKIAEDKMGFLCAKEYHYSINKPLTIVCDPSMLQTQALLHQIRHQGIQHYRLLTSNHLEVIASLVAAGTGIGILPFCMSHQSSLFKQMPDFPTYHDDIYLAYRPEKRELKAVKELIKAIKDHIKQQSPDALQTIA